MKLTVEVDEAELEADIQKAWKRLAKQVRVKGFRPGKAPRAILERQLGAGVGREEALRESLPTYYAMAVTEHEVDVIAPPKLEITSGTEEGSVSFDAVVEVRPVIEVTGYSSLEVVIPSPSVSDEEIDNLVQRLREQFGELEVADRPALSGDFVTIDVSGTYEDEEVDGLTADDYLYEVGRGFSVAEIDEHLIGAKAGDILEFDAAHPDPDEDGMLHFRILVKEVKEKVLPALDDDFANEASEFETLDELKGDIAGRIASAKRIRAAMAVSDSTAAALAGLVEDEVPEALVASQMERRIQEMAMRMQAQGMDLSRWLEMTGTSHEDFLGNIHSQSQRDVRTDLALRAIVLAESIEADDDEVEAELNRLAHNHQVDLDDVREQFERNGAIRELRSDLRIRKALDWVSERASLVDESGNQVERADLEPPLAQADGTEDDDIEADDIKAEAVQSEAVQSEVEDVIDPDGRDQQEANAEEEE